MMIRRATAADARLAPLDILQKTAPSEGLRRRA